MEKLENKELVAKRTGKLKKAKKMLTQVVFQYHPVYKNNLSKQEHAMEIIDIIDIECAVEKTLAYASNGRFDYIDADGRDFTDDGDSKACSVMVGKTPLLKIPKTNTKKGGLRVVVYNDYTDQLDYFWIPFTHIAKLQSWDDYSKMGVISANYNVKNNHYNRLEPYRVHSFQELVAMRDHKHITVSSKFSAEYIQTLQNAFATQLYKLYNLDKCKEYMTQKEYEPTQEDILKGLISVLAGEEPEVYVYDNSNSKYALPSFVSDFKEKVFQTLHIKSISELYCLCGMEV